MPPTDSSNEEATKTFLDYLRSRKMSPETINNYRKMLHRLAEALYPTPILDASTADLLEWQGTLAHASAGYIAGELARARQFYKWARRPMRWITESPAEDLVAPRVPKRRPRPVPETDVERAITFAVDYIQVWIILMRYLGLRCCEVAWMSRDWVIEDGEPRLAIIGKGNKERVIPVSTEVLVLLRPWMARQGRIFIHSDGTVVTPRYVSETVRAHLREMGLAYTPHQLRHSFGSRSLDAIRDLRVVQELMGHDDPATTALYTQVSSKRSRRVATINGAALHELQNRRRRR